jgi:hypothetical protein
LVSISPSLWSQPRRFVDQPGGHVDVGVVQRLELPGPEAGVDGGRPQRPVARFQRCEHLGDLVEAEDPPRPLGGSGQAEAVGRVALHLAGPVGALVDRPDRCDRAADRLRRQPVGGEAVDEPLQLGQVDVAQVVVAEGGKHTQPQVALVGADGGRLERLARRGADDPGAGGGEPAVGGPLERGPRVSGQVAAADVDDGVLAPALGGRERGEGAGDALAGGGVPDLGLEGRGAGAGLSAAAAGVTQVIPCSVRSVVLMALQSSWATGRGVSAPPAHSGPSVRGSHTVLLAFSSHHRSSSRAGTSTIRPSRTSRMVGWTWRSKLSSDIPSA